MALDAAGAVVAEGRSRALRQTPSDTQTLGGRRTCAAALGAPTCRPGKPLQVQGKKWPFQEAILSPRRPRQARSGPGGVQPIGFQLTARPSKRSGHRLLPGCGQGRPRGSLPPRARSSQPGVHHMPRSGRSRGYAVSSRVDPEWHVVPARLNEAEPNGHDTALSENALRDAVLHQSVERLRHLLLVRLLPVVRNGRDEINRSRAALGRPRSPLSIDTHSSPLPCPAGLPSSGELGRRRPGRRSPPSPKSALSRAYKRTRTLQSFPDAASSKRQRGLSNGLPRRRVRRVEGVAGATTP